MNKNRSLSIIVPVYNSEGTLSALVDEVHSVLNPLGLTYEMILVNDGSRDQSWQMIEKLVAENPGRVRGVRLMRNYGQHNALLCGIRVAKNEICVTMDDDLQHPASAIPQILEKLDEGFDVVYATPNEETHGFFRDMASVITKLALANTMNSTNARNVSAFRGFRTNVRDAFSAFNGSNVAIDVLLSWATTRFGVIKVSHRPRTIGKSNYSSSATRQQHDDRLQYLAVAHFKRHWLPFHALRHWGISLHLHSLPHLRRPGAWFYIFGFTDCSFFGCSAFCARYPW